MRLQADGISEEFCRRHHHNQATVRDYLLKIMAAQHNSKTWVLEMKTGENVPCKLLFPHYLLFYHYLTYLVSIVLKHSINMNEKIALIYFASI